jgi:hypothetical protein
MENQPSQNSESYMRFEDKGSFRILNKDPPVRRWEMNLGSAEKPFDDMVNCLAVDSPANRVLALATEKGKVYIFDLKYNRLHLVIPADHWIGSLVVGKCQLLVSNFNFMVSAYWLKSGMLTHQVSPSTKHREGFGPKGIIFTELKTGEVLILNTGYLTFKLYSLKLRKVLRTFTPFSLDTKSEKKEFNLLGPIVKNYDLNARNRILTILLKDDPHLYLWDLLTFRAAGQLKLYNQADMPGGMHLVNSVLLNDADYCFVLLQFAARKPHAKIVSLLLVIRVNGQGPGRPPAVVLFDKLRKMRSPENGHDLFLSQIVSNFKQFDSVCIKGYEEGYVMGIGTNKGYSLVLLIDIGGKKVINWAYYKKFEGSVS